MRADSLRPEDSGLVQLPIHVGERLQLQPVDGNARHYVTLVGFVPGKSLLVTTPRRDGKVMLVREGQPYTVRMFTGNAVHASRCTVLKSCARPFPYLHLSYPTDVQSLVLRRSSRVKTWIEVALLNRNREWKRARSSPAVLIDISTTGARLLASEPIGEKGQRLELVMQPEVGDRRYSLVVPVIVRRELDPPRNGVSSEVERYGYGVEFQPEDDRQHLILHAFVYELLLGKQ